jgi:GGDEF domain-containing protein
MHPATPRRRRPRPLPDAPVDLLLRRSEALARGWLIALVEELPLREAGRLEVPELVAGGQTLCEAMLRAVADEGQLRRLQAGAEAERLAAVVRRLAGGGGAEPVSRAVECLRSVLWWALAEEFIDPSPDQLFHLGERLALVAELVRAAALRAPGQPRTSPAAGHDEREEDIWQQLLSAAIARASREGARLALLLVELEDTDRLLAVASPEEAAAVVSRFEAAVWAVAAEQGEVLSDAGRAWVIALGLDRRAADSLAARVVEAVAASEGWRGAPLRAAAGVAVLGEDGEDAAALLAAAEEAKFLAQAAGGRPEE